ncbi:MAG: hypothetical protein IJ710_02810 [Prevotella sp.]|nr:hypothetical protein [Prevotella sp.]
MKRAVIVYAIIVLCGVTMLTTACRHRPSAQDYERQIDSIRRLEQAEMLRMQGLNRATDPVEAALDTMGRCTIPLSFSDDFVKFLPGFKPVPVELQPIFGNDGEAELLMVTMPPAWHKRVVMLAERRDSVAAALYLLTIDGLYEVIDQLCIYQQMPVRDERDRFGEETMQFFITSNYNVTLLRYFRPASASAPAELKESRRYAINREGMFEEKIIEL